MVALLPRPSASYQTVEYLTPGDYTRNIISEALNPDDETRAVKPPAVRPAHHCICTRESLHHSPGQDVHRPRGSAVRRFGVVRRGQKAVSFTPGI